MDLFSIGIFLGVVALFIGANFLSKKYGPGSKGLGVRLLELINSISSGSERNAKQVFVTLFVVYIPLEGGRSAMMANNYQGVLLDILNYGYFIFLAAIEFVSMSFAVWNVEKMFQMFSKTGGKVGLKMVSSSIWGFLGISVIILWYTEVYYVSTAAMVIFSLIATFFTFIHVPGKLALVHLPNIIFFMMLSVICTTAFFFFTCSTAGYASLDQYGVQISWELILKDITVLVTLFLIVLSLPLSIALLFAFDAGDKDFNYLQRLGFRQRQIPNFDSLINGFKSRFKIDDLATVFNKDDSKHYIWLAKMDAELAFLSAERGDILSALDPRFEKWVDKEMSLKKLFTEEYEALKANKLHVLKKV